MFGSPDLILLIIITVFILYKLYNILGSVDENDENIKTDASQNFDINTFEKIIEGVEEPIIEEEKLELPEKIEKLVIDIKNIDPSFNYQKFIKSAGFAFEMIIDAFSKNDANTLSPLLSKDTFSEFKKEIEKRIRNDEVFEQIIVSVDSIEIISGEINDSIAKVSLKIQSNQINLLKNTHGKILEGNPSHINHMVDIWTFARDLKSSDPAWKLIETNAE